MLTELTEVSPQETADEIVDIFSQSEPSQLVSVCVSPALICLSPGRTLQMLQHLEDTAGVSVALTIVMATMALRVDDLPQYTQLMDRHTEVRGSATHTVCKKVGGASNKVQRLNHNTENKKQHSMVWPPGTAKGGCQKKLCFFYGMET